MTTGNMISIRAFAAKIHVSEGAVRKAIESGKIVNGYDPVEKKINFTIAYDEYGHTKTAPRAGHGVSKNQLADKLNGTPHTNDPEDEPGSEELEDMSYTDLIQKLKISSNLSYKEALRRGEILKIAQDKIKLEETQNNLVRKADVDKALFELGSNLKKELQNVPNRCISMIRGAATDIEGNNILIYEINQVLESFAAKLIINVNQSS